MSTEEENTNEKINFYIKDNLVSEKSHISPSGKYTLIVQEYYTKKGCWNYTKGLVYNGEILIAEVPRNYAQFPFEFVESHPDGHDYLFCGEDYQGQTVIQLDTGIKKSYLHPNAKKGVAFCWAAMKKSPSGKYLFVEGCYWAVPGEFRIYDISKPLEGNNELPLVWRNDDMPSGEFIEWINDNEVLIENTIWGDEDDEDITERKQLVVEYLLQDEDIILE